MTLPRPLSLSLSLLASLGLTLSMSAPAYAANDPEKLIETVNENAFKLNSIDEGNMILFTDTQELITEYEDEDLSPMIDLSVSALVEIPPEPEPEPIPEPVIAPVAPAPAVAVAAPAAVQVAPPSAHGNALLGSALAQLGAFQDCTALVENALRALGYSVGDLGPMQFGMYGVAVDPSQVQPGDIMMRGGHVAIYAGDGVNHAAVHGGFNGGNTVHSIYDADPYAYAQIIRVQ